MSWRLISRAEVEADLDQAAAWYEKREPGLATRFLAAIAAVRAELRENPFQNSERHRSKHIRFRMAKRFPYRVIYRVEEETRTVLIISVLHAKRHDRHWRERL